MESDNREYLFKEYSEVCLNIRHYSNIRFAELTIFFVLMVAMGGAVLGAIKISWTACSTKILVKVGGLIFTIIFWFFEDRGRVYINHFVRRARELEQELNFTQYSTRPEPRFLILRSDWAARFIYLTFIIFWLFTLIFL